MVPVLRCGRCDGYHNRVAKVAELTEFLSHPQRLKPLLERRSRECVATLGTVNEMDMAWMRRRGREARHDGGALAVAAIADVSLPLRRRQSVFDSSRHARRTVDDHAQRVVELPEIR